MRGPYAKLVLYDMQLLQLCNLAITGALIGLIWTIQLVHYPAFRFVTAAEFVAFERFHTQRISLIVMPLMLAELALGLWLCYLTAFVWVHCIALLLIIGVWLSTFFLSVPCHNALAKGKDDRLIRRLVISNWPRTILWSVKGVLLVAFRVDGADLVTTSTYL